MLYLALTCAMLLVAIVVHGLSAWLQRRHKIYDHLGPTAWATHQFVIAPAWIIFFIMSTQISNFLYWPMPVVVPELGWAFLAIALILILSALFVMDIQVLTNGWLFGHGPRHTARIGIYRHLKNPLYDGIALLCVAAAFIGGNAAYLVLAGLIHVLLNHFQARLEDIAKSLIK